MSEYDRMGQRMGLRMGMVGGGPGAFIGEIHRMAAALTGDIDLVAGAFSRDAQASRDFGPQLGLDPARSYASWADMLAAEAALPAEDRIQFVSVVTPNDSHADITCAALDAGFHVLCDKPAAGCLEEALRMQAAVNESGLLFGLTHTYTGYPLVIEARARVASGALGDIRRVAVSYLQDWLSKEEDTQGSRQATWRNDPMQSGEAGAFADIGTHAFNLVEFMTGEQLTDVAAQLRAVVPGRELDDDGACLFRLSGGGQGLLSASQVCTGSINSLRIEIFGSKASLSWDQEQPNTMIMRRRAEPAQVLQANMDYLSEPARAVARTPGGHPEGYIEAFANLYAAFARDVRRFPERTADSAYASIDDGVAALRFVRGARVSTDNNSAWTSLAELQGDA